jgi:pimeloyl-ACP methyl ester carboxylesterase
MALAPAHPGITATLLARLVYRARSLPRTVRHLALLIACLAVFALSALQIQSYESAMAITRSSFMLQGAVPVPVLRFTPRQHPLNVVAVIAHGYSADKEMMSGLAVDLARQGITVYTFDFPGHGASTVPYGGATHTGVVSQLVTSLGEVVDYSLAHRVQAQAFGTQPKLVLIGYSLGTIAVGEYALQHPAFSNLQATVLVAGILSDQPTKTNPRNLLVLSGQFDLPGINDISRRLIASGCGVPIARVADTYSCGIAASAAHPQTVRERVVLSGLDHISIITAGSTHATILHWLGSVVDPRVTASTVIGDARIHWLLIGFLAATLAALAVLILCAAVLRLSPVGGRALASPDAQSRAPTSLGSLRARIALFAGVLIAALLVLRVWLPSDFWAPEPAPFGFLNQQVSADVALFLLVAGAFLLAALRTLTQVWRSIRWPSGSHALREVALAFAVVGFLYLTLGRLSSFGWESLALSPARLGRAGVYAVMVWPFFLGVRALFQQHQHQRQWRRGALVDFIVTLLMLGSLGAAIALNFARLSYLGILLSVVAILLFAFIGLSTWMRRLDDNVLVLASATQALLLGWLLAATLPLVG